MKPFQSLWEAAIRLQPVGPFTHLWREVNGRLWPVTQWDYKFYLRSI